MAFGIEEDVCVDEFGLPVPSLEVLVDGSVFCDGHVVDLDSFTDCDVAGVYEKPWLRVSRVGSRTSGFWSGD